MSERERFERAFALYTQLALSPEKTIGQLLRAGHAPAMIRERYPGSPEHWFSVPPEPYAARAESRIRAESIAAKDVRVANGSPAASRIAAVQNIARQLPTGTQARLPAPVAPIPVATEVPEGLSYQYVPLIQCSFPHTDPGRDTLFVRRNGWLEVTLSTARADSGLPYGVPARLLTIYCASEAVRRRSPEIYLGRSVHEFLRLLDVPVSRGERGSLRTYANQLLRLIRCAISVDENINDASGRSGLHIRQTLFVQEARLWWDEVSGIGQGSSLVLSPVLFDSIVERSAPLSTDALRQLRKSPMDLDIYAWLVHRLFSLSRPSSVTWEQLSGQFGHNYGELRYFRRYFGESLKRVLKVYPEARLKCSEQGILLLPSRPHVSSRPIR